jgi:hypothetical protein
MMPNTKSEPHSWTRATIFKQPRPSGTTSFWTRKSWHRPFIASSLSFRTLVSFEYRDFKAVCVLAIDESSTTGLLNTLNLKEHVLGNEIEMRNDNDGGSESDAEMEGMVLRSGTVVARG